MKWTNSFILPGGAKKKKKKKKQISLIEAINKDSPKEVQRLLKNEGVDPNARDNMGNPALMLAMAKDQKATVNLLLDAGANVLALNNDDDSILLMAVGINDNELVQSLLKDPDVQEQLLNQANNVGQTPLISAAKQGNGPLVKILLDAGADPDAKDNKDNTSLMYAIREGSAEIAQILINADAEVNAIDLLLAVDKGLTEVVQFLIKANVNPNAMTNRGTTALMIAATKDDIDTVKILLDAGADPNATTNRGSTALMAAAVKGSTRIARRLIKAGANLDAKDNNGNTALTHADRKGHTELVELLKAAEAGQILITISRDGAGAGSGAGSNSLFTYIKKQQCPGR